MEQSIKETQLTSERRVSGSEIIQLYKSENKDVDALVIKPHGTGRRALISFSGMNPGKYERWSWFHDAHASGSKDLFIVFKDDLEHYYLGQVGQPIAVRHIRFIKQLLEAHAIPLDRAYMVGTSMGGYSALFYGFEMGAGGVLAINPQVDYASARMHRLDHWARRIRELGSHWIDLDQHVRRFSQSPRVCIVHGDYPADRWAAHRLVNALEDIKAPYMREFSGDAGHANTGWDATRMFALFDYWSSQPR